MILPRDPNVSEPPGTAQQDRRARAPGVLRLGARPLRGALATASRRHATPNSARGALLHRPRATAAPRPAPIRGLPPHSAQDADDDGSMSCSRRARQSARLARYTSAPRAWSSAATRPMPPTTATPGRRSRSTAPQRCSVRCHAAQPRNGRRRDSGRRTTPQGEWHLLKVPSLACGGRLGWGR